VPVQVRTSDVAVNCTSAVWANATMAGFAVFPTQESECRWGGALKQN